MGNLNNITAGVCDKRASGFLLETRWRTPLLFVTVSALHIVGSGVYTMGEEMTVPKNLDAGPLTAGGSKAIAGD